MNFIKSIIGKVKTYIEMCEDSKIRDIRVYYGNKDGSGKMLVQTFSSLAAAKRFGESLGDTQKVYYFEEV